MKLRWLALCSLLVAFASCAAPAAMPDRAELSDQQSREPGAPACGDDCRAACAPYGEALSEACSAAYLNGCFEKPRVTDYDCSTATLAAAPAADDELERTEAVRSSGDSAAGQAEEEATEPQALPVMFGD